MVPESIRARAGLWLEVCHAAKILGVSDRMVRIYVEDGLLPERRRGEKILIFTYEEVLHAKVAREQRGRRGHGQACGS